MKRCLMVIMLMLFSIASIPSKKRHLSSAIWMKGRWQIIWQDNFSNDESWKNWVTEDASPGHILSSRWRDNVRISRGRLLLLNKKETRGGRPWTTGCVYSRKMFRYGYIESRFRISKASGVNNAFWLFANSGNMEHHFEIDIAEVHYSDKINLNIHDLGSSLRSKNGQSSSILHRGRLAEGYHVYGVDWEADSIKFYVDNKLVRAELNLFCHEPAILSLSTAVLNWAGHISDSIDGTKMEIDYVRVYSRLRR